MNHFFEQFPASELVKTNRILNTPSDFAKKALFYVQETGYLKSLRTHLSERSNLDSFLFMIVLSGKGNFTYQGTSYVLQQHDCAFIHCKDSYSHQSTEEDPWELLWVHFNGTHAMDYYRYFSQNFANVFYTDQYEEYITLISKLIDVHQQKAVSTELIASKLLTDLLTVCTTKPNYPASETESSVEDKLYSIRDYLNGHYSEKISLESLSEHFYISKYHLSREFKRVFGTTISDYLLVKRITHAKELLRFTKQPIEDIAIVCGIPDASYFNKVFRKSEGMTASEYRKRW